MILSGLKIKSEIEAGNIEITPFDESRLNPNSYNLRLGRKLLFYTEKVLDIKKPNRYESKEIPDEGLVLCPGRVYLGSTLEWTRTDKYVPMLEGRSSYGRLGLFIHITAGFGDIGFSGYWTVELACLQPIRIYPEMEIAQIYYHTVFGDSVPYSSGKYQNNNGVQASKSYEDFLNVE